MLNAQQFPTNAIFGAVKTLQKIKQQKDSPDVVFFLDKGRDPRRKSLLPEYKANRSDVPDPVKVQIPVVKEFAYALGLTVIERSGIEADDLIASFANKYQSQWDELIIFSTDKDFAQCIEKNIFQIIPNKSTQNELGLFLDRNGVWNKFGVYPEQIVDYLSLIGDQADNIPGINGVGPKTASKWLNNFSSIENLLQHIDEVKPERFRSQLTESKEILERNRQLIELNRTVEDIFFENNQPDENKYQQLISFYHLNSLKNTFDAPQVAQEDLFSMP